MRYEDVRRGARYEDVRGKSEFRSQNSEVRNEAPQLPELLTLFLLLNSYF